MCADPLEEQIRKKERAAAKAVVESAAVEEAIRQGIRPRSAPMFIEQLADLSSVPVTGDYEPDQAAVRRAVKATLDQFPELRPGHRRYGRAPGG